MGVVMRMSEFFLDPPLYNITTNTYGTKHISKVPNVYQNHYKNACTKKQERILCRKVLKEKHVSGV